MAPLLQGEPVQRKVRPLKLLHLGDRDQLQFPAAANTRYAAHFYVVRPANLTQLKTAATLS
jgi:hypothetical protein